MEKLKKGLLIAGVVAGLATWYSFTSPSSKKLEDKLIYPLPEEIKIVDTSFNYETKEKIWSSTDDDGKVIKKVELEKILKTKDIDFSKDFVIKTERYRLVKDDDWLPSRIIGHAISTIQKLFLWDWDIGWGLNKEKSRAVLSILENNKDIKDLTVRINHNEAIYDCYRLFGDDKVEKRNNWFARVLLGLPTSILGELFAELRRGDYYNPMNQTAVLYSNIESISGHEIGHHQDFQRFNSDWEYVLSSMFPPVKIYKEWQASTNSRDNLSSDDKYQFNRYLLPCLFSYILAGYFASKKILRKVGQLMGDENPEISSLQTLRFFTSTNLDLYAGLASYGACLTAGAPLALCYAGFAGGFVAADIITTKILKHIIPYNHEVKKG